MDYLITFTTTFDIREIGGRLGIYRVSSPRGFRPRRGWLL